QVLLAEVTLDSSSQWGLDLRVGPFGGEDYRTAFLGAGGGITAALGVPNFAVSSTDFELLVRALEAQGRLEVLSRPQILVKNNEEARIQVGENIAIVEGVERLRDGNTRSDVTRKDVGIILNVIPTINADGYVSMDIMPEISSVSARTTQISEDFQAPIIDTREVETNVTVRDGETVVIGGLIQTRDDERNTRVPVLSSIPLLGEAFKSKRYSHVKTELLVILTPRVVRSGSDHGREMLRRITREEIERLSGAEVIDAIMPDRPAPGPGEEGEPALPPDGENGMPPIPYRPRDPEPEAEPAALPRDPAPAPPEPEAVR
ncbi:MAG TPA: hypothetical protein VD963_01710, partial [Phycisphaerales bacterium]|nr:hypothetical protein [Phycisphaerales bacterium]